MSTAFLSRDIWPQLTKAARGSRHRCAVAVAYFGAGASRLLPLPKGSRLVVDASERSVASGQTCPADLIKLVKRGVAVYSVPNLHAKVFVLGRAAYIGSANVSNRSAVHLVEAAIRTTERSAVGAARQFVREHCLQELTPTVLKRLAKLYRPPLVPGGKRGQKQAKDTQRRATLPRVLLVQTEPRDLSKREQHVHDLGLAVAKNRRQQIRGFELDSFLNTDNYRYLRGDVVIQVHHEGSSSVWMGAPANVLHLRTRRYGNRRVSFVYLERPVRRRRRVKSLARVLGCPPKALLRDRVIRDQSFAQALLNTWAVTS